MKKDDRVPILSIRRLWVDLALKIFSVEVITYTILVVRHEVAQGNSPMETAQVIVVQLAAFIVVSTGSIFILFQGVDSIMFLTQLYKERLERKVKKAKAEGLEQGIEQGLEQGLEQGIEQGKAEGLEQGKAEVRQQWAGWNTRRVEAEAKGISFDEPPPSN